MTTLLEVQGLSKFFSGVKAVVEVDWTVGRGELWGVVGPNGSGKSTLFNTVSGFYRHTAGNVVFDGRPMGRLPMRARARQGLMRTFQHAEVFGSLTVEENLIVAARAAKSDLSLLHAELEVLGLMPARHVSAGAISFGKRRLLGVAMAAATKPSMLLLDEPTSGLNDAESAELALYLRKLHADGLTLAIVDHHMEFLLPLCERMLLLRTGEKIWEGTPDDFVLSETVIETYLGTGSSHAATPAPQQ